MTIRAAVFDLDGTLIDSLPDLAESANYALAQAGFPTHEAARYRYFVGDGVDCLIERILPDDLQGSARAEAAVGVKKIYLARYGAHALDQTRPYDGIVSLLATLRRRGLKLAVVSNKPDAQTKRTVSHLFANNTFHYIAGANAYFPLKPDPALTLHALSALGASPAETLYVGDTGTDMRTAKNAHCTAVGVTWGFRTEAELRENLADYIIHAPKELLAYV